MEDHDRNLVALLERAREVNLKLNPKKLRLRLSEVPFIGHLLTSTGVKPDPEKARAVQELETLRNRMGGCGRRPQTARVLGRVLQV